MNVDKTQWPPEWLKDEPNEPAYEWDVVMSQPGFGVEILWNEPQKPWKPCLVILFWRWRFQVGWMY